jgi:filamentous hemagglutinin
MRVGFSAWEVATSEVGRTSGLAAEVRTAAIYAHAQGGFDAATGLPVSIATGGQGAGNTALSAPIVPGVNPGHPSGSEVGNAGGIDPSGRAQAPAVAQSALERSAGGAQTVRTSTPSFKLPDASLFRVYPSPSAGYLVETDPRFTNYQQWTGSDYMLAQLNLDPALTQKRLGDAFYEQKLVRDQVAQLTGQRFLDEYTSDDEEYRGLMDAGIEYAKALNLRPGVALTAEQMGALTKDMVWLVAQEVTLADGAVQKVLAPQVYVASHDQDLTGAGAVISGRDVKAASTGDLTNTGSIFARNSAQLVADNINNLGGRIQADSVVASAKTDINNIAGTISAGHELIATAGRDINVETTTRSASSSVGGNQFSRTTIDGVGSLAVTGTGGTLVASAGRDINLVAAKIENAGTDGNTLLDAGRNLNLATVTTASSNSITWDSVRYRKESSSTEAGTVVQGAGAIAFKAGADINLRAASVDAGKDLTAIAGNNLNILAGVDTSKFDQTSQTTKSGFLHHETITTRNTLDATSSIGSVLGGATVNLSAGQDLKVVGSSVVGDKDVNLIAKNAISIEAATNQSRETHYLNVKESGLLSGGGGFGISFGTRTTTTNQDQDASIQSGLARSIVGSIGGNLNVSAGEALKIAGSDLSAGKDINLAGKSVAITTGVDDVNGKFTTKMTQDALTLAIGGSVVNAIQTAQNMGAAAGQTSSGRLKALAAASAALTARDAAQDLAKNGPSVKISLTVGHSESESTEVTASITHIGSVLAAGNNVNVAATGGANASNIDIVGSDVHARGNVSLAADNQVNLLAAQDTESQHSQSKSWSASVGVAAELSSQGPKYGFTASASASRGNVDGEGTTQVNSHVSAGETLTIASGGDTNLKGAVASANQVVADIKGNLNIESLQDTATLDGKRQSASVSGTVGAGAGFSASFSQSKVHNDFASVQEQSGIRAGDGGFQLQVAGNTDLKGGVISSSEQAIKDGRNSLATATLSFSDIQNRDSHDASGVSLGVNVGKNQTGDTFSPSMAPSIGQVSGSQASVTRSGVSGAALTVSDGQAGEAAANLKRDVSTGKDTAQSLTKGWTGAQALDEVAAQMQITSAAMPRLAKEIGDYAASKVVELKKQGNSEEAAKWDEGGVYRVAAHAVLGAMGGGLEGAVGAAAAAEAAPTLGKLQDALQDKLASAGLGNDAASVAAKLIAGGTAGVIGGVAGSTAGAVMGLNADVNNRQLHPDEKVRIKQLAAGDASKEARLTAAACALVKCYAEYPEDSAAYKQLKQLAFFGASEAFEGERALLSAQPAMFGYSTTGLFSDANIDSAKKLNNTYQIGTRLVGTGKLALGTGGVVVSAVTAPVSCATGIGCFANAAAATISLDAAYSGSKQLISGNPTETYLNQGLQSLGLSPKAAAWVEAGLGIGSAAAAWSVANKAVDQTIALSKAAAGSYRNTVVGDEPYSLLGLSADSTTRSNVLTNIAASSRGNASSNFSELVRREALVSEALAANQSPWPLGYTPAIRPMGVGEQFNMVIDANQAAGLSGPGGFATFSNISSQAFARDTLAITQEFKKDVSFVQRFEVIQTFDARIGPIGPQIDQVTGGLLEGSKSVLQLDLQLPWNQRIRFIRPVGTPVPIK